MTALPRNLDKLSFAELSALERQVTTQMVKRYESIASDITQRETALEAKQSALRDKLARMATDLNSHTVKVFGAPVVKVPTANGNSPSRKRRTRRAKTNGIAIKYRDPANPANTWTGRGRPARWLSQKIKQGAKMADFSVTSQAGA